MLYSISRFDSRSIALFVVFGIVWNAIGKQEGGGVIRGVGGRAKRGFVGFSYFVLWLTVL